MMTRDWGVKAERIGYYLLVVWAKEEEIKGNVASKQKIRLGFAAGE